MITSTQRAELDHRIVIAACRLLASDADVGAGYLEMSRRPGYAELLGYRRQAADLGFTLTVSAHGMVLRRHAASSRHDAHALDLEQDRP